MGVAATQREAPGAETGQNGWKRVHTRPKWPQKIRLTLPKRGYPRSPPDNRQPPTDNRQPLLTANCHQLPTAKGHQPPTRPDGPKNGQKWKFPQVVPNPWGRSNGHFGPFGSYANPVLAIFSRFWPVLGQSLPGLENVSPTRAQNRSKMTCAALQLVLRQLALRPGFFQTPFYP